MKTPMSVMALTSLFVLLILATCGGEGIAVEPTEAHASRQNIEVMGSWMVQGQSVIQYSLTFYPDDTFSL
jgi:hypothetical protein